MKVIEDMDQFDEMQMKFLDYLLDGIVQSLAESGLKGKALRAATESVAFSVTTVIDGSVIMRVKRKKFAPILTFAKNGNKKELISSGGGSWMHEYVVGYVEGIFGEE